MKILKSNIGVAFLSFFISANIVGIGAWLLFNNSQHLPIIQNLNPIKIDKNVNKPAQENILLLGKGGKKHDGGDLTDTIMIAQILNPEKQINLISIPRDFLVFDSKGNYSKINSIYVNAINQGKNKEESIKVLQDKLTEITGISFNYYAEVDFAGFVKIIDKIGGVEVDVTEAIDDPYYPGPNYSYQRFTIPAGIQTLDGETALKYSRTRYTSVGGDLDRSRRQQQIISNMKDKIFSLNPVLDAPKLVSLIGIVKEAIKTDLSLTDVKGLYDTYQDSKDYTVKSLVIGNNLLTGNIKEGHRQFGTAKGYILEPRISEQNYLEIQEEISNSFDIAKYEEKLTNLRKNKSELEIIWGENLTKIEKTHIQEFLQARGFRVKVIESNKLDIIPLGNTLYLGNNPYQQNQSETSSEIENVNISTDYIKDIFQPTIDTQFSLTKDTPILYITNTLKF
jgi:LCP family protein required for cell wall assembly